MHVVGLDIGGANLKAASADGACVCRPFEIWKAPQRLAAELAGLLSELAPADLFAITMTAELADCFQTKHEGIESILSAVQKVAGARPVFVWQTGAEFVEPAAARDIPQLVAAANWHVLATFAGRMVPQGPSLLLDIGSTTTDTVPLLNGAPTPTGLTDCDRLQSGELVYSGVERTPVCAIAHTVPLRGGYCPLAAELFATTLDVYLTLKDIPESAEDCQTANGLPRTVEAARDRLCRMLCCDRTEILSEELEVVARFLADVQMRRLLQSLQRVTNRMAEECRTILIAGSGSFLARRVIAASTRLQDVPMMPIAQCFDPLLVRPKARAFDPAESADTGFRDETHCDQTDYLRAEAACAFAVARLACERLV